MRVVIIGGGVAGLTAAYYLSRSGVSTTIFEAEPMLGGLASSFPLADGHYIERYYHFICLRDNSYFELLGELGLRDKLRWRLTKMGLFYDDRLHPFGEPWDLLTFPGFGLLDKIRFGWGVISSKSGDGSAWEGIKDIPAPEWLVKTFGQKAYEVVHKPLIELKFGSYASQLSAAWMWARIHRLGKSRTRITQREKLGYLEGGTQLLIGELERAILENGGHIYKNTRVQRIHISAGRVSGISYKGQMREFHAVISTVPSPSFIKLPEGISSDKLGNADKVPSIGVVCLVLRLDRPFSPYFWTNISDPQISLAGVIEYTNLNPCAYLEGDSILYLPQYLPSESSRYSIPDDRLFREYTDYLKIINPHFSENWVKEWHVFRDRYAQPICKVGSFDDIPAIKFPIRGLYMTDSCQLHPHDRTVSNSIGLGKKVAGVLLKDLRALY